MPRPYRIHDGQVFRTLTGPEARAHRRAIRAEQDEALARYDADPSPANRSALLSSEGIEEETARRMAGREAA